MTILIGNLRRIFKRKLRVFVIVILPAIVLLLSSSSIIDKNQTLSIGIIDQDRTDYTALFKKNLASQTKIVDITQDQINNQIFNSKVDYVVVFDKGFTAGLLKGEDVEAKGYYLKNSRQSLPVRNYVQSYLSFTKRIALATVGNEQRFYEGLQNNSAAGIQLEYRVLAKIERLKSYYLLGTFIEVILLTSVMFIMLILTDKEKKTYYRTLTAPISLRNYMFQNILSFLLVSMIQVILGFMVLKRLLGIYMGNSSLSMFLLLFTAAVLAVSLGVAISSIAKSILQASFLGLFITFFMGMLGGCLWEHDMATNLLRTIGKFTPVYWVMDGVGKVLQERGVLAVSGDILIALLFAMVFFFLGTWRKEDIK